MRRRRQLWAKYRRSKDWKERIRLDIEAGDLLLASLHILALELVRPLAAADLMFRLVCEWRDEPQNWQETISPLPDPLKDALIALEARTDDFEAKALHANEALDSGWDDMVYALACAILQDGRPGFIRTFAGRGERFRRLSEIAEILSQGKSPSADLLAAVGPAAVRAIGNLQEGWDQEDEALRTRRFELSHYVAHQRGVYYLARRYPRGLRRTAMLTHAMMLERSRLMRLAFWWGILRKQPSLRAATVSARKG